MGTTIRQVIFDIGGGPKNGRQIKAVQTGGPSGGCLPASQFHLPLDFDALGEAGSMMGRAGWSCMDDSACMVDVAKYFLTFLQDESCGKCVPAGSAWAACWRSSPTSARAGGVRNNCRLLEDLAWTISVGSLCALGKTAPNPVLSTLRYFRHEYEAHIEQKQCPACVCRALFRYAIDADACVACGQCEQACPSHAIGETSNRARACESTTTHAPDAGCVRKPVRRRPSARVSGNGHV